MICSALALLTLVSDLSLQDAKLPVPGIADQDKAVKELRDAYKVEYGRRGRDDRRAFARRLLGEAAGEKSAVMRFVLLREAREISAESLDLEAALEAVDATAKAYDVKPAALRASALSAARKGVKDEEDASALAEACLRVAGKLPSDQDHESATAAANAARDLAQVARSSWLAERARQTGADLAETRKEHERFLRAELALSADKDNAAASLDYGRFLCFFRGEWEKGLPFLAKSGDGPLKAAAEKEAAKPSSPEDQADTADAWHAAAAKEKAPYRRRYLARALHWYEEAWERLPEREKARLEKKIDDAETAAGRVNLLLVRTAPVSGVWSVSPKSIGAPAGTNTTVLEILYIPPAEYDLELTVVYNGIPLFLVGLVAEGSRFHAAMDNRNGSGIGDQKGKAQPEATFRGEPLSESNPNAVVCSVRRSGVTVSANGKIIMRYNGSPKDLSTGPPWTAKNPNTLFLGYNRNFAGGGGYQVTSMVLVPVSGKGQRIR